MGAIAPRREGDGTAAAAFSPGKDCLQRITGQLRGAEETADICVFTITDDRISREILGAFERGVRVRVLTDNDKAWDRGSDIDKLRGAGVPVRVDQSDAHMHHKFAVFDERYLLTGSYNWTRSAAMANHENVVLTDDAGLVRAFARTFENLWEAFA